MLQATSFYLQKTPVSSLSPSPQAHFVHHFGQILHVKGLRENIITGAGRAALADDATRRVEDVDSDLVSTLAQFGSQRNLLEAGTGKMHISTCSRRSPPQPPYRSPRYVLVAHRGFGGLSNAPGASAGGPDWSLTAQITTKDSLLAEERRRPLSDPAVIERLFIEKEQLLQPLLEANKASGKPTSVPESSSLLRRVLRQAQIGRGYAHGRRNPSGGTCERREAIF